MNKPEQIGINNHYSGVSNSDGARWSSTMLDREIREKEIENLVTLISEIKREAHSPSVKVLDIGCGNGYVAARLQCEFPFLEIDGVDSNLSMVEISNSRKLTSARFYHSSASNLQTVEIQTKSYDLVFSTRCFINIMDEIERYESIKIAGTYVKAGGFLALMEGFESGQTNYNKTREGLGFKSIPPAWHNIYLNEAKLIETLNVGLEYCDTQQMKLLNLNQHFLSNRYLAMRVLLPLFKNDPDYFNNNRNDPMGLALSYLLPETSNFSPLQLHLWKKNKNS